MCDLNNIMLVYQEAWVFYPQSAIYPVQGVIQGTILDNAVGVHISLFVYTAIASFNSNFFVFQHLFCPDPNLVRTFLMTYRSFCQPNELLDLLVERYKIPSPDGFEDKKDPISMKAMKTFKITYQTPIQLRCTTHL